MAFKHKHAASSRVTYTLQPNGALAPTALVVVSVIPLKPSASTSDSGGLSMLARAAKKYADENKIPSVILEDGTDA